VEKGKNVLVELTEGLWRWRLAQAQANLANAGGHGAIAEYHP